MVGRQDLFFLLLSVPTFWFKNTAFPAVFAPVLLTAAGIVSIFNDVLAVAISAFVDDKFCYHAQTILQITSTYPPPERL